MQSTQKKGGVKHFLTLLARFLNIETVFKKQDYKIP